MTNINFSHPLHVQVMSKLNIQCTDSIGNSSSVVDETFIPGNSPIIPAEISLYKRCIFDDKKIPNTRHLWDQEINPTWQKSAFNATALTRSIVAALSGIQSTQLCKFQPPSGNSPFVIFDSYNLWASGHYINLEETIRILCAHDISILILKDDYMTLWPDHLQLLVNTYNLNVIDITGFSFSVTYLAELIHSCGGDACLTKLYPALVHPDIIISTDSLLNPDLCVTTSSMPTKPQLLSQIFSESAFTRKFTSSDSLLFFRSFLFKNNIHLKHEYFVVLHTRNEGYHHAASRDGLPHSLRAEMFTLLDQLNISCVIIGIYPECDRVKNENVVYLCDDKLSDIPESLQLHAINASIALIGNLSGMTLFAGNLNKPLIWIDCPYPMMGWPPSIGYKLLLKTLAIKKFSSLTLCNPLLHLQQNFTKMKLTDMYGDLALIQRGYTMLCNSSTQIIYALLELLLETSSLPVEVKESDHYQYFSTLPCTSKPHSIKPYVDSTYFDLVELVGTYQVGNVDKHISAAHWLEPKLIITTEVKGITHGLTTKLISFVRGVIKRDISIKYVLVKFRKLFR